MGSSKGKEKTISLLKIAYRNGHSLLDCFKLLDYQNGICILTHPLFSLISVLYNISEQLTERVLYEARVFIAPSFIFGSNGRRYVRIPLCAKAELMMKACNQIVSLDW